MSQPPLIVDLDGTLILTDTLHEAALRALRDKPAALMRIPYWLSKGKAYLKQQLAAATEFDASALPYNQNFLSWLVAQHKLGRSLILCTASDQSMAQAVAAHLGIFDTVIASDGIMNLAGGNKAHALEQRFGRAGFDYAGNAEPDLKVWQYARRAIVVNASAALAKAAGACCEVEQVFARADIGLSVWRRVLRVHQWM